MDAALTDLLVAAETAGDERGDRSASTVVADAASDAVAVTAPRGAARDIRIIVEVPPELSVIATRAALARALIALLDNAVRHSPPGGTVTVSAMPEGRFVRIRVADQGGGIRGVDPARIFERFTGSGASAPGSRRGFGLGLALVRDVAARFGGDVFVERTSPQGTVFALRLPAAARGRHR